MKDEKDKLEPAVKANRELVDAYAEIFARKVNEDKWWDRIFAFFIGVISSIAGMIIYNIWTSKRKARLPVAASPSASDQRLIFYDDFSIFEGWQDYKKGSLDHSVEKKRENKHSLKKIGNNDPHGGYKIFQNPVSRGFIFSGWIYRQSEVGGGKGDRLAIEDSNFNGYGFFVSHINDYVEIELRESGKPSAIKRTDSFTSPKDKWYYFKFTIHSDGKIDLNILGGSDNETCNLSVDDTRFNLFDRVVVHGGNPYYLSDLKVERI